MKNIIHIDIVSSVPKYKQIIASVNQAIINSRLRVGDRMPSLNELCKTFSLSQDTVLMAYNELKTRGIISSAVGKGYYVASVDVYQEHKVFVLFDKLTAYKELLYDSMQKTFGRKGTLDIFFHHSNEKAFKTLLNEALGNYTSYIIMPLEQDNCLELLSQIPAKQLYLLDRGKTLCSKGYYGVFQDFRKDTYNALQSGIDLLKKYDRINVVTKDHRIHLHEIIAGCKSFCSKYNFNFRHLKTAVKGKIQKGDVFLVINDKDLVALVQEIEQKSYEIAKDIGLISYNDSPLKQISVGGITTISTDFETMGKTIVEMIIQKQHKLIDNPSNLIIRNSL